MNLTDKAKTINGLMIHLRDDCNVNISGSKEKLQLTQYGYYHGYKGYRFIKHRQNTIPYAGCINNLYKELPLPIYNKIVATGIKGRLAKLNLYVKK